MVDADTEDKMDVPDVGTKVVQHRTFGGDLEGEVVPAETWSHPQELTPDSFVVDFGERRSRYTVSEAEMVDGTVYIAALSDFARGGQETE